MTREGMTLRQRDVLVAEKVMGWRPDTPCDGEACSTCEEDHWYCTKCGYVGSWGSFDHFAQPLFYTTDLVAAQQVENEIEQRGLQQQYIEALINVVEPMPFDDVLWTWMLIRATPDQRCRAALRAVGGD